MGDGDSQDCGGEPGGTVADNIYLVATPLQLLSAIEARGRFPADRHRLIVLLAAYHPASTFRKICDAEGWRDVSYVEIGRPRNPARGGSLAWRKLTEYVAYWLQFRMRTSLNRIARKMGGAQRLFVGNYFQDHMRHFANRLPHRALFALDDGTDTLRICEARKATRWEPTHGKGLRERLHAFLHGLDSRHRESITFFSAFALDPAPGDSWEPNRYDGLRSRFRSSRRTTECWFLGQPLFEDGYLTIDDYVKHVRSAMLRLGTEGFRYLPHKREASSTTARLVRELGVSTRVFELPIEYQLAVGGETPRVLASFFSSALENCRIIFGRSIEIAAFVLPDADLLCAREDVAGIYRYLRSWGGEGFQVFEWEAP